MHKRWYQVLAAGLAGLAALVLVLIAVMDRPYMGEASISPEIIRESIARIEK
ncbi:hypothetical protein [Geomonas subterranea]